MKNFTDILFWIFTILSLILVLWLVFGNSPTELFVSSAVLVAIFMKILSMSEKQVRLEMRTKNGFSNMKSDINLIKNKLGVLNDEV